MLRTSLAALMALAVAATGSCLAYADGYVLPMNPAEGDVGAVATGQRALLWEQDKGWDLIIEPIFARESGDAAWIVPFPVKPTVSQADPTLLDQLDWVTSPVFVGICTEPLCKCWCEYDAVPEDGANSTAPSKAASAVTVWEHGTVGDLDYVILSSTEGESLTAWLIAHGYILPDPLLAALENYSTEETFFFVSSLSEDADPSLPLAPIRFHLTDLTEPFYPLRLTQAAMTDDDARLRLTLWVFQKSYRQITSHPIRNGISFKTPGEPIDAAQYAASLEGEMGGKDDSQSQVVLTYLDTVGHNAFLSDYCNLPDGFDDPYLYEKDSAVEPCINRESLVALGIEIPDAVHAELLPLMAGLNYLYRYDANLKRDAMTDIGFTPHTGGVKRINNIHGWNAGMCNECPVLDCASICAGHGDAGSDLIPSENGDVDNTGSFGKKKSGCGIGSDLRGVSLVLLALLLAAIIVRKRSRQAR